MVFIRGPVTADHTDKQKDADCDIGQVCHRLGLQPGRACHYRRGGQRERLRDGDDETDGHTAPTGQLLLLDHDSRKDGILADQRSGP